MPTSVLITHDVAEATALADRVLVLRDGRIELDEPMRAPRPRDEGDPDLLALKRRVLAAV